MAGAKQFNPDKALEGALRVFWDLGYEATSVKDLTEATGLSRSSLYNSFGNKEELFLLVLDRYLKKARPAFFEALAHDEIKTAILGALTVFRNRLTNRDSRMGCFLVLASENSETRAPEIRRRVAEAFAEEERAFYNRLRKAQVAGQISPKTDPRALARFFSAQGRAMAVNARIYNDPSLHDDVIETALEVLSS